MNQWHQDVLDFHLKFDAYVGQFPHLPSTEIVELRKSLITEEYKELIQAIDQQDLVKTADSIIDLLYVVIGAGIAFGIDLNPLWILIQAANMAKEGGGNREDGKILKPPGWQEPDIAGELRRQLNQQYQEETWTEVTRRDCQKSLMETEYNQLPQ